MGGEDGRGIISQQKTGLDTEHKQYNQYIVPNIEIT